MYGVRVGIGMQPMLDIFESIRKGVLKGEGKVTTFKDRIQKRVSAFRLEVW